MTLRQLGGGLSVIGGLLWIVRWLLDPSGGLSNVLLYVGLGVILIGLMCIGLTLVKGSSRMLDVVVGFAMPALVWSVYWAVRVEMGDDRVVMYDGVVGVLALVVGGLLAVKSKPRELAEAESAHA